MMNRFICDNHVFNNRYDLGKEFQPIIDCIDNLVDAHKDRGALNDILSHELALYMRYSSRRFNYVGKKCWADLQVISYPRKMFVYHLASYELFQLTKMYETLYPNDVENFEISESG